LEQRLQQVERLAHGNLLDLAVTAEIEPVARPMGERNVGGAARPKCECDADQLALHRIEGVHLYAEGEIALIARVIQQNGETLGMSHRLVVASVEGKGGEFHCAPLDKMQGRAFPGGKRGLGPLGSKSSAWASPERMVVVILLAPLRCRRRRRTGWWLDARPLRGAAGAGREIKACQGTPEEARG